MERTDLSTTSMSKVILTKTTKISREEAMWRNFMLEDLPDSHGKESTKA